MWIHLSKTEYGLSYGSLPAPFHYMGIMLEQIFQEKEVEFPYREIEIGLIYNAKTKLPYYYRGKYMVKVNIAGEKEELTLEGLLRLIYQAFEIIISKKKKEDNLDGVKVLQVLRNLENELRGCDAREVFHKYKEIGRQMK